MKRADGRAWDELRPIQITPGFQSFAEGSALIELGKTRVLCSVSVEERVPGFLKGEGTGWITAEYAMLPRATVTRTPRDSSRGRVAGRSQEIQRLIGRSLRAVTDLTALGERTLIVDCDVLQADGGTRTAAIVHSYRLLDLCYDEDYKAEVDFNVVMTSKGEFVEVQGTAEAKPFSKETIDSLLSLAEKGINQLFQTQQAALESLLMA